MAATGNAKGLPYVYKPFLDPTREIRLLRMSSQNGIKYSIEHYQTDACPSYFALSYMWGPEQPEFKLNTVDGYFMIRENLHDFLATKEKSLPLSNEIQYLWIDQLCIDQKCLSEKSQQIQQMAKLYSQAESVIVWLGRDTEARYSCFVAKDFAKTLPPPTPMMKSLVGFLSAEVERALGTLFGVPYWRRLWIVQEVMLARNLQIHCSEASLTDYEAHQIFSCNYAMPALPDQVRALRSPVARKTDYWLYDLLPVMHKQQCHSPYDRIYGLNALFRKDTQFAIDYHREKADIFIEVVEKLKVELHEILCRILAAGDEVLYALPPSQNIGKWLFGLAQSLQVDLSSRSAVAQRLLGSFQDLSPEDYPSESVYGPAMALHYIEEWNTGMESLRQYQTSGRND